jgi:hypothetical protein
VPEQVSVNKKSGDISPLSHFLFPPCLHHHPDDDANHQSNQEKRPVHAGLENRSYRLTTTEKKPTAHHEQEVSIKWKFHLNCFVPPYIFKDCTIPANRGIPG